MSSVEFLREFVSERLTAAAEEIFRVLERTIVQYEEEINRQRKLLDVVLKPRVNLQRIELPERDVCKEEDEDNLSDQHICNQEMNFSLNQNTAGIKVEQGQLCIGQEGEHLLLKQKTFILNSYEESDHQFLFHPSNVSENQGPIEGQPGDSGTVLRAKSETVKEPKQSLHHRYTEKPDLTDSDSNTLTGETSFECDTCGETFDRMSGLQGHSSIHTGKKLHPCNTCGKVFSHMSALKAHVRIHTGEKPYSCKTCGKDFRYNSELIIHMRIHTGEKPFLCKTCGKDFRHMGDLRIHMRIHTGEKPFSCSTCGKNFCRKSQLKRHTKIHLGEKSFIEMDFCPSRKRSKYLALMN